MFVLATALKLPDGILSLVRRKAFPGAYWAFHGLGGESDLFRKRHVFHFLLLAAVEHRSLFLSLGDTSA
jgi:hypothetical protein